MFMQPHWIDPSPTLEVWIVSKGCTSELAQGPPKNYTNLASWLNVLPGGGWGLVLLCSLVSVPDPFTHLLSPPVVKVDYKVYLR